MELDCTTDSPGLVLGLLLLIALALFGAATPSLALANEAEIQSRKSGELGVYFYEAMQNVYAGNLGHAAKNFEALRSKARGYGYRNLPDFSFEILDRAGKIRAVGREDELKFLLHHAVALSPENPEILYTAASYREVLGSAESLSLLWKSFKSLWAYPLRLAGVGVFAACIMLVGLTVSVFLVLVIQILRNTFSIFGYCGSFFGRRIRGFAAPFVFASVLILPLWGGIAACLAVWSMVLACAKRSGRSMALLVSVVLLLWASTLPLFQTVLFNSRLKANLVVEDINNFSLSPRGEEFLRSQLEVSPDESLLLFALGEVLQLKRMHVEALRLYNRAVTASNNDPVVQYSVTMNSAVIAHAEGRHHEALLHLQALESQGWNTFELNFNLSLLHLAQFNTELHRSYFSKAKAQEPHRVKAMEELSEEHMQPIMATVPRSLYWRLALVPVRSVDETAYQVLFLREQKVLQSFLPGTNTELLFYMGLLTLVFALFSHLLLKRHVRLSSGVMRFEHLQTEGSTLWSFIPFGRSISGDHPAFGAIMLALLLGLLFLALEIPTTFSSRVGIGAVSPFRAFCFLFIALLILVSFALPFLSRLRAVRAESEAS